jgi:hypothetical protein
MKKTIIVWVLAVFVTVGSAVYQRVTGPTYPLRTQAEVGDETVSLRLPRSNSGQIETFVEVPNEGGELQGSLTYRRFPTTDEWTTVPLRQDGDVLKAELPRQPAAGKLEYYLTLRTNGDSAVVGKEEPVRIRFTDPVNDFILIPHILFMFIGMLFTNVAAIMVLMRVPKYKFYLLMALILLFVGGLILGPLVQWQAFGDLWTGWPFGNDLTDNKLLIAVIALGIAYFFNLKKDRPVLVVLAALVVLIIFSIPHSVMGSELDYSTGEVTTG